MSWQLQRSHRQCVALQRSPGLAIIVGVCALLPPPLAAQNSPSTSTAEELFENIQVLKQMPAEQMGKVMNLMSAALGVQCGHCHPQLEFAKEGVPSKDISREMLHMTLRLNREHFAGRSRVTCYTCHRGQLRPAEGPRDAGTGPQPLATQPVDPPTANQVLERYLEALGGEAQQRRIATRHVTAERVEPDGRREPESLWLTEDGQYRLQTEYGPVAVVEATNGHRVWKAAGGQPIELKADEVALIEREAQVANPYLLREHFRRLKFDSLSLWGERQVVVLTSQPPAPFAERWLFAADSGLLLRRSLAVSTVLGDFVVQVDYQDYRDLQGCKVPWRVEFDMPGVRWSREVQAIDVDVEVDPSQFEPPPAL